MKHSAPLATTKATDRWGLTLVSPYGSTLSSTRHLSFRNATVAAYVGSTPTFCVASQAFRVSRSILDASRFKSICSPSPLTGSCSEFSPSTCFTQVSMSFRSSAALSLEILGKAKTTSMCRSMIARLSPYSSSRTAHAAS
uniref:(northern house mosquito) hypothetical protein n=1 Tax=Culex pipiens TaxID=7175 RepID=A0A8D8JUL9_CULPI